MNPRLHRFKRAFAVASALAAGSSIIMAQSLPEPPLPVPASRESRAAAAAVQTPNNVRPPPPIPTQIPGPIGGAGAAAAPQAASPIPPQPPDSALPAQRSPAAAPAEPSQLPTGFTSKVTTSTSASGQFKVYGKDLQTRSLFSSRCDEIAEKLKRLLRDDQPWVLPVVVSIKTPPDIKLGGPAVSTTISQITNGGFHLQVTVQVRPDLRPADIDAELTRILIAERILRNKTAITTKRSMVLPEWLLTGVAQAMNFRDRSRPSAVFTAIFKSGKIYGIEEILDVAPGQLDALSRTIYETSCCALVLGLLDQTEGPASLRQFLSLLAVDSRDDRALLNYCFPRLALSASSLNKWWSLQMASLATPTVFETLGPTATRKALTEALVIHYETTTNSAPKRTPVVAEADEPPAEAPVDEKKRGLLGRIFGTGSSEEPSGTTPADDKTEAGKPKPDAAEEPKPAETDQAVQEDKKRGLFGRMFGGSGSAPEEPAVEVKDEKKQKTSAAEADAPPEPEKSKDKEKPGPAAAEEKTEEPKKPGLLGRMFGGSTADQAADRPKEDKKPEPDAKPETKKEKPEDSKPEPKPEPTPKEKPAKKTEAAKPATDEAPAEPKKRGFLGRMFGSGGGAKSDGEPDKKEEAKPSPKKEDSEDKPEEKKKSAAADSTADPMAALRDQLMSMAAPWLAEAEAMWADLSSTGGHQIKLRLPFGKKKTDEPEKPEEEKAKENEKPKSEKTEKPKEEKAADEPKKKPEKAEPEPEKKPAPAPKPKSEPAKPRMVHVSIPLEDYSNIMKRKDRAVILTSTSRALAALLPRAHVLFRPIINDYLSFVADLQEGKTKDAGQRLATLRSRTAKAYDQAKAVEDHLDWYEASETKNYSGTFDDYLELPELIEKELPVRDDPLSRYLDSLDLEFGK